MTRNHLAARGESCVGHDPHETDLTPAIDDSEAPGRENLAAALRRLGIGGQQARAGTTINADASHMVCFGIVRLPDIGCKTGHGRWSRAQWARGPAGLARSFADASNSGRG